jgi:hypothetical protein
MPVWESGKKAGEPVGWLSLNRLPTTRWQKVAFDKVRGLWRTGAYSALVVARVPRGLARAEVAVELRFTDRTVRDPSNYELTIKPVIDALGPQRIYESKAKKKDHGIVVEHGRGVIPGDDPRYLVRPNTTVGEPLGRTNPIKGIVTLTIRPLPALEV